MMPLLLGDKRLRDVSHKADVSFVTVLAPTSSGVHDIPNNTRPTTFASQNPPNIVLSLYLYVIVAHMAPTIRLPSWAWTLVAKRR